jgi:hypothetical protein
MTKSGQSDESLGSELINFTWTIFSPRSYSQAESIEPWSEDAIYFDNSVPATLSSLLILLVLIAQPEGICRANEVMLSNDSQ